MMPQAVNGWVCAAEDPQQLFPSYDVPSDDLALRVTLILFCSREDVAMAFRAGAFPLFVCLRLYPFSA
jgi:hypothetical protein